MLEARTVGDGASGRNSGFVLGIRHQAEGANAPDLEPARRIRRISQAATTFLDDIVSRHRIRCDWKRDGMYIAGVGGMGAAALDDLGRELERLGEPFGMLDRAAAAKATGTAHYAAMLHSPNCILMQPRKLVQGLAEALPANVALFEDCPVIGLEAGTTITATTTHGTVRASRLVLAVNGAAPAFGYFGRRVFALRIHASMTRPLDDSERKEFGARPWGILPAIHTTGPTLRLTEDHRILVRAGFSLRQQPARVAATERDMRALHLRMLRARFPNLHALDIEHTWWGEICLSRNHAHGTAAVAPNVFTAVCDNGVGATKATVAGIVAADMALGERHPLADDLEAFGRPALMPPSPLFELGFRARRAFDGYRARSEL